MDASDLGLCVLHPARKQYVRVLFDDAERSSIKTRHGIQGFNNVREQLSTAYALLLWGPSWKFSTVDKPSIIQCWLDNSAAVAWRNRLSSPNEYSLELSRLIGDCEAHYNVMIQASHLPGASNTMADAGSRAWSTSARSVIHNLWSNLSLSWQEIILPPRIRKIYDPQFSIFNSHPLPSRHSASIPDPGSSGPNIVRVPASHGGFQSLTPASSPFSWLNLPFTAGSQATNITGSKPPPCAPNCAISLGIRVYTKALHPGCTPDMNLSLPGCDDQAPSPTRVVDSQLP